MKTFSKGMAKYTLGLCTLGRNLAAGTCHSEDS